jgi:predicted TIM-barrel fold metal-dependent hydrolase
VRYDCHVEVLGSTALSSMYERHCETSYVKQLKNHVASRRVRAVLVQPVEYGGAHRCLINALSALDRRTRAVASVTQYSSRSEIDELESHGACGTRFVVGRHDLDSLQDQIAELHRAIPATWHVELLGPLSRVSKLGASLARVDRNFVIYGRQCDFDVAAMVDLERLSWWSAMGNLYVKLVGEFPKISGEASAGVHAMAQFIETARDRMIWGSGWPASLAKGKAAPTVSAIARYARDFENNACDLYKFESWRK